MTETVASDLPPLAFRPLSENLKGVFSCSEPEIDKWFKRCFPKHQRFVHRVTTVHFDDADETIGFYALSMKLEHTRHLTAKDRSRWAGLFSSTDERFICLNFDYLAVAKAHQNKGVGTLIVGRVIEEFAHIASACGVEIMTGSAMNRDLLKFYTALGFQEYGHATEAPQMFLPALAALELVSA